MLSYARLGTEPAGASIGPFVVDAPEAWCASQAGLPVADLWAIGLPQLTDLQTQDRLLVCGRWGSWRGAALALQASAQGVDVLWVDDCCDPAALALIQSWSPSVGDWSPWQLRQAAQQLGWDSLESLQQRQIWLGGARVPDGFLREAQQHLSGRLALHYSGRQWPGWSVCGAADGVARPGTVGRWQVASGDVDQLQVGASLSVQRADGATAPAGQVGELVFHVEETSCPTGDLGYIDDQGFVFPLGRTANAFVSAMGGYGSVEGERVLERHEQVAEAAMLALDDTLAALLGVDVGFFAAVELERPGAPPTPLLEVELLAHCQRQLSATKRPRGILFVERLPRLSGGAVDLAGLAALLVADLPQQP